MMLDFTTLMALVEIAFQVSFVLRAILRPNREPASRTAWVLVIVAMPYVGILAYVLFGETNIGERRLAKYKRVSAEVHDRASPALCAHDDTAVEPVYRHLFHLGRSVNGLGPIAGSTGALMEDSAAAFDSLVADIDAATETVHLLFYIWLDDTNGLRIVEAAKRAARRGVKVRVMADDIGSRRFVRSSHWADMRSAGVHAVAALPIRNIFLHPFRGRIDLRNHRKIAVIDNRFAYCGSYNCADPEFRVKARFAPWVDEILRFEGPVAVQMQFLFIQDWMAHTDDDLTPLVGQAPEPVDREGIVAQVIGTGPTVRASAMPEIFETLIHAARRELLITTPYYVPSDAMHDAICTTARRGVRTVLMLPEKNDSWIVAAASRSYYPELIEAGVRIFEYPHGLLHAKILTLDGEVALTGSANLDRRSFELNFENNVLIEDRALTARLIERQESYIAASNLIDATQTARWTRRRRMWNNAVAMMGPIL